MQALSPVLSLVPVSSESDCLRSLGAPSDLKHLPVLYVESFRHDPDELMPVSMSLLLLSGMVAAAGI